MTRARKWGTQGRVRTLHLRPWNMSTSFPAVYDENHTIRQSSDTQALSQLIELVDGVNLEIELVAPNQSDGVNIEEEPFASRPSRNEVR